MCGSVSQGGGPRSELSTFHELKLDALTQTGEQCWPVSGENRLHEEGVFVDQSQIGQRQEKRHTTDEQALSRLLLEAMAVARGT